MDICFDEGSEGYQEFNSLNIIQNIINRLIIIIQILILLLT